MGQIEALLDAYNPRTSTPRTHLHIVLAQDQLGELGSADHKDFVALMRFAIDEVGIPVAQFAKEYQIADSTVGRWYGGSARPHPALQALVRKDLYERLTQELTRA